MQFQIQLKMPRRWFST